MGRLIEMLRQNSESGRYPLHMPGHKRAMEWNINPYAYDITEIYGFDDLHKPEGVLAELNGRIAARYGADEAFLTVNGSTSGVMTAISAAVRAGGTILLDRGSHRSAYSAVFLRRLCAEYIYPRVDIKTGINMGYTADEVDRMLRENPRVEAVFVTSPTYEGVILDIAGIAGAVHARGIPLIVDAAHGAHLGHGAGFLDNALKQGADIVIMSLHKTLPAFTQTAVICVKGGRIKSEEIRRYFNMYVSTSPSYLLMASAERCMDFLDSEGAAAFEKYRALLENFRGRCEKLRHLYLWKYDGAYDNGKITVCTDRSGISGPELAKLMRTRYRLEPELVSERYVLLMTSCMDGEECYERLWNALSEIDSECLGAVSEDCVTAADWERAEKICDAWETEGVCCGEAAIDRAVGEVAADYIYAYPPGIPWIVPGERITEDIVRRIRKYMGCNMEIRGLTDSGGIKICEALHKTAGGSDI